MKYAVIDSYGQVVRVFKSKQYANNFRIFNNRHDWKITKL